MKLKRNHTFLALIIVCFISGLSGAVTADLLITPRINPPQPVSQEGVVEAVKIVKGAVVSIISTKDVRNIFGRIFEQTGGGTGFIFSAEGLVLTNKHVVADEKAEYSVVTAEGEVFGATVLSRDPVNDLAVVKIVANKNFPTVTLGSSDALEIGQTVIAIGNVLGEFQNTVTVGVVSGLDRSITASSGTSQPEKIEKVIQTDAAINPGNSGGPLINLKGEVVGVNTAVSREGQLIGFAIPIDDAKTVISSVLKYGEIKRPLLGVRYQTINKEIAAVSNLPVKSGALLSAGDDKSPAVIPNSPAAKAGLKEGDIIIKVGDKMVSSENSLSRLIQSFNPGQKVELEIVRAQKRIIISVSLGELK